MFFGVFTETADIVPVGVGDGFAAADTDEVAFELVVGVGEVLGVAAYLLVVVEALEEVADDVGELGEGAVHDGGDMRRVLTI